MRKITHEKLLEDISTLYKFATINEKYPDFKEARYMYKRVSQALVKQDELLKLYQEAYILFMDIEYLETGGDEKQLTMTWEEIDKRYDEVKKEIKEIENE